MSLTQGVFMLLMSGAFTKVMGVFYRVPLSYLLGAEGIGLYQMAYPIFTVAAILATGGLPLAIAKFMAEHLALGREDEAWQYYRVGGQVLIVQGLLLAGLLFAAAPFLATAVLGDPRAELPLRALAPAVFFLALEGSLRGCFQGQQALGVLAQAQALEQLIRVLTMLGLAFLLLPRGLEHAAAGAAAGAAGGAAGSVLYFEWRRLRGPRPRARRRGASWYASLRRLEHFALPVMFGSFIMPVMQMVDAAIVPVRLQAGGIPMRTATALFGQHAGMALSLVGIPTVATAALATALVPSLAAAAAQGDRSALSFRMRQALGLTLAVSIPAAVGLYTLPEEICQVLFNTPEAAVPLRYLAFGTVGLCLMETSSALLHSLNLGPWAAVSIFAGGALNALLDYHLAALPALNIRGAALGTALGFTLAAALGLLRLMQRVPGCWSARLLLVPALGSALMVPVVRGALAWGLGHGWPLAAATLGAVAAGAASYGALALGTGIIPRSLLTRPPLGPRA
ncbi:polysaccharide biosynthesis protein [Gelria sp. Kuro-4]|uniref:polysaccharide biosynthesis protein n=1 Tax=Gelria sp. Kuro-4 TaxID=2796927 RepID=UPI001BEDF067|nr:polysaccharide biosynthesis protein [Gelria sp. Kuro-4]BCV25437.1 polysaccharide biosynthesis protein [Gelria sp. Kuro-4]